eukprot:451371_1
MSEKEKKLYKLEKKLKKLIEDDMYNKSVISNQTLNTIYKHNQTAEKDHIPSAPLLWCYGQWWTENVLEIEMCSRARMIDPFPLRCTKDNFLASGWNDDWPAYINGPFSNQNQPKCLEQAIYHWEENEQSVLYLTKLNNLSSDYWFYNDIKHKASYLRILRKTFSWPGYDNKTPFGVAFIIFNKADRHKENRKIDFDFVDLDDWALSMNFEDLIGLAQRANKRNKMT